LPTGTMPPEAMVVDEDRRLDSTEYGDCFRGRAPGERTRVGCGEALEESCDEA